MNTYSSFSHVSDPAEVPAGPPLTETSQNSSPIKTGLGAIAVRATQLLSLCIFAQVGCTLLSRVHPVLELATHASMHALIGIGILLPLALFLNRRRITVGLAVASVYLLTLTQPWTLLPASSVAVSDQRTVLRVLSWNVLASNPSVDAIEQIVRKTRPDILVLIEVRPGLLDHLESITSEFPLSLHRESWSGSGIALFSKIEGTELSFMDLEHESQPAILASIPGKNSSRLQFAAVHTLSPIPVTRTVIRDRQLQALADWAELQTNPLCICGDLNITPWAQPFQNLIDQGFIDSRIGVGNCPSWPSALGILGIPIDHALSKGDCVITDRTVHSYAPGSDHLPIQFKIAF